jgi:hypothetical protein
LLLWFSATRVNDARGSVLGNILDVCMLWTDLQGRPLFEPLHIIIRSTNEANYYCQDTYKSVYGESRSLDERQSAERLRTAKSYFQCYRNKNKGVVVRLAGHNVGRNVAFAEKILRWNFDYVLDTASARELLMEHTNLHLVRRSPPVNAMDRLSMDLANYINYISTLKLLNTSICDVINAATKYGTRARIYANRLLESGLAVPNLTHEFSDLELDNGD